MVDPARAEAGLGIVNLGGSGAATTQDGILVIETVNGGTTVRSLEPTNTNGNNVNLDSETVLATETGLRYQLALNALDGKYNVMRTALRTQ